MVIAPSLELSDAENDLSSLEAVFLNTPDPSSYRVAPISKLPPELLAKIFVDCSTLPDPSTLPPKSIDVPLVLTLVSRTWRDLALQLSELWADISVTFDTEGLDVQRISHIAEQWLSRPTDAYPLSITAECTGKFIDTLEENPDLVSSFMAVVLSHAHHVKHLDLAFPSATLRPLFDLPSGTFLRLETLHLHPRLFVADLTAPDTGYCGWHWPGSSAALESAPALREVVFTPVFPMTLLELTDVTPDLMTDEAFMWTAPTVSLPWAQLSFISFIHTAFPPDVWCSILAECPKIVRCDLGVRPGPHSAELTVHLDRLERLYVFSWSGAGDVFLDCLVAPKLQILMLNGQIVLSTIQHFRARSNFELALFSVEFELAADEVEHLFREIRSISGLILPRSSTHFHQATWDRIARGDLLPHLERLVLYPQPAQMPLLVDFIAANWDRARDAGRDAMLVIFCNVRPAELPAVNEGLKPLEKYVEMGTQIEFMQM
ncbi:hypothetical protein DFH06DRAFT_1143353 [Mycena polygramma]|nr:hypothetical protein DFH06DRAFT_1143353 [Mycena polygramma]